MKPLSRRDLLIGAGSAVGGALVAGSIVALTNRPADTPPPPEPTPPITVDGWAETRKAPYFIGHRGAGGVVPEHSLPGYLRALEWGVPAIEISVVLSADNVLYCLHDLTLERTTTLTGRARAKTSAELDAARINIPQLGPGWQGSNMPPLPRLTTVLAEVGGKAVLCIEPKDDAAYPLLAEMIEKHGLKDSTMLKLDYTSRRIEQAKASGFHVFAYLGNADVATESAAKSLAGRLDPKRDVMVLPSRRDQTLLPERVFQAAVATGIPVWVFPVHRRQEVDYFARLGVEGMLVAAGGYVNGAIGLAKSDDWASGKLTPGQLTRNPYSKAFAVQWPDDGLIAIPTPGRQAFTCLGQFAPVSAPSYRIAFDVAFDPMPSDSWQHVSIAFGHADDRYYEHRLGDADGYHALLRADGSMGLYAHVEGDPNGQELVAPAASAPLKRGLWARMTLDVTPTGFQWARDDGTVLIASDSRFRGGYFHIGSSALDGALKLRGLAVG